MAVYLVQHITNTKPAIDLAIAFYSKLQLSLLKRCINCWVDTKKNSVFYLIKASQKKTIKKLYYKSTNLHPHKIIPVNNHLVYAFLKSEQQLKMIQSQFEFKTQEHTTLFIAKTINKHVLLNNLKKNKTRNALLYKKTVIKNLIHSYDGNQININNKDYIALFPTFKKAFDCSFAIQKKLQKRVNYISTKFILYPYSSELNIKNSTSNISKIIDLLYFIKTEKQFILSSQLSKNHSFQNHFTEKENISYCILKPENENFLFSLLDVISENYQNPDFSIPDIASLMMMCKTSLYRNCKAVTGSSINQILKEYRLLKSINSIASKESDINQISIDVGFNSLSYFSNCFKKKFGITPSAFLKQQNNFNLS